MEKTKTNFKKRLPGGFTLAELIVVITILAILATVGFLALSGYSLDAKDSATKANVRSVYAAITAESALTGNSPRYYVVHDSEYALSGGIAFFDGNPTVLTGGDWNVPNTNYSAGNPDYAKLKMNPEKFKTAKNGIFNSLSDAMAAANPKYLLVGAADATLVTGGKSRTTSLVQIAGTTPSKTTVVTWNFTPSSASGSVTWLIRDVASWSLTWSLIDGKAAWTGTDGACGSANGTASVSNPATGLCSVGNPASTDALGDDGAFDWTCSGIWGGATASCSAPRNFYASCAAIKTAAPTSTDGTYSIDPDWAGWNAPYQVYCDMTTDGGGWTLLWSALKNGAGTNPISWTVATDATVTSSDPLAGNAAGSWWTANAKLKSWNTVSLTTVMVRENSSYDKMAFTAAGTFNSLLSAGTLSSYTNVSLNFNGCNNVYGYCWSPSISNALRTPTSQPCSNGYYNSGLKGINLAWYHDGYCNSGWASYPNKWFFTAWYAGVQETSQSVNRITNGVTFWGK